MPSQWTVQAGLEHPPSSCSRVYFALSSVKGNYSLRLLFARTEDKRPGSCFAVGLSVSRFTGHKLLLPREPSYLAPTGRVPDTLWGPPDPGCLRQQDQRRARLSPTVDCCPQKLENPCPSPQRIKGSGAQGEEDWKPRRRVSQSEGQGGRGSHVKWLHCRPPRGMRAASISSFQDIGLRRRKRRHAVQGKQHGGWRGGPHVVCVSGRLDLEGFPPSESHSLTTSESQSRPGRPAGAVAGSPEAEGSSEQDAALDLRDLTRCLWGFRPLEELFFFFFLIF